MAALDQLDDLVDDRARLGDPLSSPSSVSWLPRRRIVQSQALAQRPEHAVPDARQLGGDVVRDRENFLQLLTV